jgi:hypothetical protein
MTSAQWAAKEKARFETLSVCFGRVVADVHALQTQRIFVDGQNSQNTGIGSYNTTDPLYVNPANAPKKFPTKGKTGKSRFKNGKPHKTGYFKSYSSFRQAQGRQTAVVDLRLSGMLFRDYASSLLRLDNKWIAGVKNKENAGKINGAIKKYGATVFKLTDSERKILNERAAKCFNQS